MVEKTETKRHKVSPLTVVTTHQNADFDAVASCLAASKLFEDSAICLPGSQEKAVREYLKKKEGVIGPFFQFKEIDLKRVCQIVIVDTNQRARIGDVAELLERPGIRVFCYDHHQEEECDIPCEKFFGSSYGANTTLLVKKLREKDIKLEKEELTLFLLGIYEDTGSFTFSSTTPEDLKEAAWLLEMGADIDEVSLTIGSRFTPEHILALNDLLESAQVFHFGDISVTVAKATSNFYLDDFAVLVHELMDMGRLSAVFTLAMMGNQVIIVGRSRDKRVDCGKILRALGGGGHSFAASASLKDVTLSEAENRLISQLGNVLGKSPRVRDIMSSPVVSVEPETPIYEVHDVFAKYGFSVIPVAKDGKIKGYVTRNIVEKALFHGLGKQRVSEYMQTEFTTLSPDDDISRVQECIVEGHQRFIPVTEDGRLIGIITRTDLLEILSTDPTKRPERLLPEREQKRNVSQLMKIHLPKKGFDFLKVAGEVADELGVNCYVVGGFVRDLLLRRPNFDIDLVVEGDGIAFAQSLSKYYGARVRTHKKFGTSVIIFPDGKKVDVATARWEYYEYPAAMPTVALSSIKLDLFRRDFTINTLAIKLNTKDFGQLIDFFGGQRDLKDGVIRVLHSLSFIDDPTRILRAVRFEKRFGFKIGKHTLRLIKNSLRLGILKRLSPKRLFTELKLILEEPDPRPCLKRLSELSVLKEIHPGLVINEKKMKLLDAVYDCLAWYELLYLEEKVIKWKVYLCALLYGLSFSEAKEVLERFGIGGKNKIDILSAGQDANNISLRLKTNGEPKNSQIVRVLEAYSLETLLFAMALHGGEVSRYISLFIRRLSRIRPLTTGEDIKRLGFTPGPIYRNILERLKEARLDGLCKTKEDEIRLIKEEFGELIK